MKDKLKVLPVFSFFVFFISMQPRLCSGPFTFDFKYSQPIYKDLDIIHQTNVNYMLRKPNALHFMIDSIILYATGWPFSLIMRTCYLQEDAFKPAAVPMTEAWKQNALNWHNGEAHPLRMSILQDTDPVNTNIIPTMLYMYLLEPMFFAKSYLYYASRDYHIAFIVLGTVLQSLLYDFTIRAFYQEVTWLDLIKNPAIGIPLGYIINETAKACLKSSHPGIKTLGFILNPFYLLPWSKPQLSIYYETGTHSLALLYSYDLTELGFD